MQLGLGNSLVTPTLSGVQPAPVNGFVYDVLNFVYDDFYLIYQ